MEPSEPNELERHQYLATAVPIPILDWSDKSDPEENLQKLYLYARTLAYSVIDWYLRARRKKKRQSIFYKCASLFFLIMGAIIPLFLIFIPYLESKSFHEIFGTASDAPGLSAEASLVLIGIAGAFNLADRLTGASMAWMRYISTAVQLQQMLIEFSLRWKPTIGGSEDPRTDSYEKLMAFCHEVLEIVRVETAGWAEDSARIAARLEQIHSGLSSRPR